MSSETEQNLFTACVINLQTSHPDYLTDWGQYSYVLCNYREYGFVICMNIKIPSENFNYPNSLPDKYKHSYWQYADEI